jgi:hypothetical protein
MRSSFHIVNLRGRLVYFDASYSPSLRRDRKSPAHERLICELIYVTTLAVSVETPFIFQPRKMCNSDLSGQQRTFGLSTCNTCKVLQMKENIT